jgi:hypothetical protein
MLISWKGLMGLAIYRNQKGSYTNVPGDNYTLQKQVILPGARIKEGKYAAINIHIGESFF